MKRKYGVRFLIATVTSVLVLAGLPLSNVVDAVPINSAVTSAANYAAGQGVRAGVAVLDDTTGTLYGAGSYTGYFGSASVVKTFMAAWLLAAGKMSGTNATTAYKMITQSDNTAYTTLLNTYIPGGSVGAKSGWLVSWASSYFHVSGLGYPSNISWCWGNTHISARGMVEFYRAVKHNSKVGPWLMNAMHHYATYGSDGTNQTFGIPSATTGAGVKQGWGNCSSDLGGSIINTTGFVNSDRYTVAILTDTTKGSPNASPYNTWQVNIVTNMAKTLMPGGKIDVPQNHNPFGAVDAWTVNGNTISIKGWGIDPDIKNSSMSVRAYDASTLMVNQTTNLLRTDVNTVYHVTGNHGFDMAFTVSASGNHTFCVMYMNTSYGTTNPKICKIVAVP